MNYANVSPQTPMKANKKKPKNKKKIFWYLHIRQEKEQTAFPIHKSSTWYTCRMEIGEKSDEINRRAGEGAKCIRREPWLARRTVNFAIPGGRWSRAHTGCARAKCTGTKLQAGVLFAWYPLCTVYGYSNVYVCVRMVWRENKAVLDATLLSWLPPYRTRYRCRNPT